MKKTASATFFLHWENQSNGQKYTVEYYYSRELHGLSYRGYKLHCIASGKNEGLKYISQAEHAEGLKNPQAN